MKDKIDELIPAPSIVTPDTFRDRLLVRLWTPTGISMTSTVGNISPADVMGLTGQSFTASVGSPTIADMAVGLTGISATFTLGNVTTIPIYGPVDTGSNTSYSNVSTGSNDSYSDVATGSNTSYSDAA